MEETKSRTALVETECEKGIKETPWNLAKLKKSERLLKLGHNIDQIGSMLRLSEAQKAELATDYENEPDEDGNAVVIESYLDFRRNANERIERKIIGIVEKHLEVLAQPDTTLLDPETMGTVKDASMIAHKWLRNEKEASQTVQVVNFQMLAQAKPSKDGTPKVLEVESVTVAPAT